MSSNNVKEHYEELLAGIYSWMCGDFNERVNQTNEFFIKYNIKPSSENSIAVDLGSGHGVQSAALAAVGFNVIAVDQNQELLNELKSNVTGKIKILNADISGLDISEFSPELIICMGDTITHISSMDSINILIERSSKALKQGGRLVLSYRDLSKELKGNERFINVKSSENMHLTCFLEYSGEFINVHDILHTNENDKWDMKVSSYRKVLLPIEKTKELLINNEFRIETSEQINGMHHIIAIKQ